MTTGKQKQSRGTDKKNGFKKFISKSHSLKRVDWMYYNMNICSSQGVTAEISYIIYVHTVLRWARTAS